MTVLSTTDADSTCESISIIVLPNRTEAGADLVPVQECQHPHAARSASELSPRDNRSYDLAESVHPNGIETVS